MALPEVTLQRRLGSHATVALAQQQELALVSTVSAAKRKVTDLLQASASLHSSPPDMKPAVEELVVENPTAKAGEATLSGRFEGTWEVFSAPHIASLGAACGARFEPIRYRLEGDRLVSNVRFSSSLAQEGWLSASGRLKPAISNDVVEVAFDKFWVDFGSNSLRPSLGSEGALDRVVGALGRAGFFSHFAVFPVLYLDDDMAVFRFPPLNSNIAVRRVA
ncbi:hypothetical protein WJX81_003629 [Elliptochloris bilobata]|uniref:Plastid lipid-associated protein/fibrillin conserved domain-containing protein n=1 Tax=Elliptochloris bilobata TaxID=381761 RepID=A0AAW1SDG6_9CHLO